MLQTNPKEKMENMKKPIITGLLVGLCLIASSYIFLESAGYY